MYDSHALQPLAHSPNAASARLGTSLRQIYKLIEEGELRSVKVGRRRLILDTELQAFLRRKMDEQAARVGSPIRSR